MGPLTTPVTSRSATAPALVIDMTGAMTGGTLHLSQGGVFASGSVVNVRLPGGYDGTPLFDTDAGSVISFDGTTDLHLLTNGSAADLLVNGIVLGAKDRFEHTENLSIHLVGYTGSLIEENRQLGHHGPETGGIHLRRLRPNGQCRQRRPPVGRRLPGAPRSKNAARGRHRCGRRVDSGEPRRRGIANDGRGSRHDGHLARSRATRSDAGSDGRDSQPARQSRTRRHRLQRRHALFPHVGAGDGQPRRARRQKG